MSKEIKSTFGKRGEIDSTFAAMFSNPTYNMSYQFYAHMVSQCAVVIDNELPAPASVHFHHDHYVLTINPTIFDNEPLNIRLGIIKHEMLHILNGHIKRFKDLIPDFEEHSNKIKHSLFKRFNIGADCAINQFIDYRHLPKNVITPESLTVLLKKDVPKNKTSEFYYHLLEDISDDSDDSDDSDGNGDNAQNGEDGSSGGLPDTLDDHSKWGESVGDETLQKVITKKMIEQSNYQTIKGRGTVPSQLSNWLEIHNIKTEVNWQQQLRKIVGNRKVNKRPTIKKRDRRQPWRRELRGKTKDRMFDLLLVADVSGSMSDNAVLHTFAEVRKICDLTKTPCKLVQIDAIAYPPEELKKSTSLIKRKGNGGTDLFPAIKMANDHGVQYDAIVIMTDGGLYSGEIDKFRSLKKRIIWLVEPHGQIMDGMNDGLMSAIKLNEMSFK